MTRAGSGRRDEDHIKKLQHDRILFVDCILLIVDFHHGHNKNKYHIKVSIIFNVHFIVHSSDVVSKISSTERDLGVDNLQ